MEESTVPQEGSMNSTAVATTGHRELFGSDDDDEEEEEYSTAAPPNEGVENTDTPLAAKETSDDAKKDRIEDLPKEDSKKMEVPKPTMNQTLVLPVVTFPARDSSHPILYTKLPNLVGVQVEAFHPNTYSMATEEEEHQQASYNLIRWRYSTDPQSEPRDTTRQNRESNTRLVEWEDGSYTLHVGKECFHVDFLDSSIRPDANTTFAGLNGYLYLSQNATYRSVDDALEPTPAGTVLECMGMVQQRMVIRPSSLQSEAHKSLTIGIRQKTIQKARIAQVVTQEDPERMKLQRIKLQSDLEKAKLRKRQAAAGLYYNTGRPSAPRSRPRMSRDYMEEDDDDEDYDTTNLKDMKRRVMRKGKDRENDEDDMDDYGDDNDDDDEEEDTTFRTVRNPRSGRSATTTEAAKDDSDDDVFLDDDDDEDVPAHLTSNKKRPHQAVIDDDESE